MEASFAQPCNFFHTVERSLLNARPPKPRAHNSGLLKPIWAGFCAKGGPVRFRVLALRLFDCKIRGRVSSEPGGRRVRSGAQKPTCYVGEETVGMKHTRKKVIE